MSTGAAKWVLGHLNEWTWLVAQYRVWLIVIITVIGVAAPLMSAARKHVPPAPALVVRSGALALAVSSAAVAICSLLHFSDLRWLPPSQRGSVHVSAPGGLFGFTKPAVGVLNSVADLPVEWRAVQLAVHTAIVCAFLALAACVAAVLAWRRARRADIRQVVREEMRKAAGVTSLYCDGSPGSEGKGHAKAECRSPALPARGWRWSRSAHCSYGGTVLGQKGRPGMVYTQGRVRRW